MIKVRQATLLDLLTLAHLGERYGSEAKKHSNFPVNIEHTLKQAAMTIQREDGCFLVSYDGDTPVGFMWGWVVTLPWSESKLAIDNVLYVVPEYRKTSVGYRLMQAWEKWAKDSGAAEVQISVASGIHEEETASFYKRLGYSLTGTQYRKECK